MSLDARTLRLRGVPLFAGVSDRHLELLAARVTSTQVRAGEWLFHEGDPGDSLYVVTAGRVDVVVEYPEETVIRTQGSGQTVGELAILTDSPRSTGVRAHRDAELIRLERAEVEQLLLDEPSFGAAITRALAERLHATRTQAPAPVRAPGTIALIPLHEGAPVEQVAAALAAALAALGGVARVDEGAPVSLEMLDRLEQANDRVLLVATAVDAGDPWTAYCLRQADRVVGLATEPPSRRSSNPRLQGCDLAFEAAPSAEPDVERWMAALRPRTTHILRRGQAAGIHRMARRLAGRSLGVVLSGGGARGFAHIGVLEELLAGGYAVDRIGGASMGSMVGSLFAEERAPGEVVRILEAEYVVTNPLVGRTIPLVALSRGERGFAAQRALHGSRRIEGLDINFFCVTADLVGQCQVVHREGLVAVAVSASQALPAFVPPVRDGDRLLVDGAVLNNLPVGPMAAMGEGPVIAVDVSGALPPPRPWRSRIPAPVRRLIVGPAVEWAPPITETVLRSILLGNVATDATARARADLVIAPMLKGVSTMRFNDIETPRAAGRAAARLAIEAGLVDALGVPRSG